MSRNRFVAITLFAMSLAPLAAFGQSASQTIVLPGLWEITVQTKSPVVGSPISHTVCIEKALLTKPDPPKSKAKDDCQVLAEPGPSNQTAFTIRCAKKKSTSTSRFTYLGDHYEGTVTISNGDHGDIEQVYTGTRIGDCDDLVPVTLPTNPEQH